ncbi:MAG: response regulator transcription factor [Terriglobia bacterium]
MSSSPKITIIVLDDDPFVCRALRTQLEIMGFAVLVFHDAESLLAIDLPREDVCLLADIYMPGMNGVELCRSLAAARRHLPTILMTGRDDEQTMLMMREAKPIAKLFKPFDEQALLRAIRKTIGKRLNPRV